MVSFITYRIIIQSFLVAIIAFDEGANAILSHQDNCTITTTNLTDVCDGSKGLECQPIIENANLGKCECIANAEFDGNKCTFQLGKVCKEDKIITCPSQTICKEQTIGNGTQKQCIESYNQTCKEDRDCNSDTKMSCTDSKCQCKKDFIEKDNKCIEALGARCTPTKGCNSDRMFCDPYQGNVCSCSLNYANSAGENYCFLRIGTSCDGINKGIRCGESNVTTTCSIDLALKKTCICNKDYQPNFALTNCFKGFDQTCETTDEIGKDECNFDLGLSCINGQCKCALTPDQFYDHEKGLCVSKSDKRCSLDLGTQEPSLHCEKGATCERLSTENYNYNSKFGYCKKPSTSGATTNSVFYTLLITMQFYVLTSS